MIHLFITGTIKKLNCRLLLFFFFFQFTDAIAQIPGISLVKQVGGSGYDLFNHVTILTNGDLIYAGYTESIDGVGVGNHGMKDFLIQCMSSEGQMKWSKLIGGSNEEGGNYNGNGTYAAATSDGGFYFVGSTMSTNGDIPLMRGFGDIYLAKISANGIIQWSKTYGGNNTEYVSGIQTTADGGCIISSTTYSDNNGDVPANHSGPSVGDIWILKLDQSGVIQWTKIFGGSGQETAHDIQLTKDGGYVFTAEVASEDGDLTGSVLPAGSPRKNDAWVVKLDPSGTIIWKKRFAGSEDEENPRILCTSTNEFVVGLNSFSSDNDFNSNLGQSDIWILKLSTTGDLVWKKSIANYGLEYLRAGIIETEDGNFIATGFTYSFSIPGFSFTSKGECDMLLYKLDHTSGDIKWLIGLGGNGRDFLRGILQTPNKEIILTGETISTNWDFPQPLGNYDAFTIKIASFNSIKGIVYYDYNNNNIKDNGEPLVNNVNVISTKTNGVSMSTFTKDGSYYNEVDSGTFNTKINLFQSGYISSNPDSFQSVFPSYFQSVVKNFALHPIPGKRDLRIDIYTPSAARLGRESIYYVKCINKGTDTVGAGTIKFAKDHLVSLSNVSPAFSSLNGDTISWNYTNFKPLDTLVFTVKVMIPPFSASLGDWLKYYAEISPFENDLVVIDNRLRLYHLITGPYDPNDKMESHGKFYSKTEYDKNEFLNYTIRFQNVGTDTAFKVVIKDTLDAKLDWNTIEMVGASHPYQLQIENGRYCQWIFDNIQLPDSNVNEPGSHGFISYRVQLKNNLQVGDTISNRASIYFDYNLPVATNKVETVISSNLITAIRNLENKEMKLLIAPNPSNGQSILQISGKLKGRFTMRILDNSGHVFLNQELNKSQSDETLTIPIVLPRLPAGVYYIQLVQKEKLWWLKLVLQ